MTSPDAPEAALIPDIDVYAVQSLRDLYLHLTDQQRIKVQPPVEAETVPLVPPTDLLEIAADTTG
jgi:predicted ATPase with chaperone activity